AFLPPVYSPLPGVFYSGDLPGRGRVEPALQQVATFVDTLLRQAREEPDFRLNRGVHRRQGFRLRCARELVRLGKQREQAHIAEELDQLEIELGEWMARVHH